MNNITVESTVKLPAYRPLVPCTHCGLKHPQDTQYIVLEGLCTAHYDACSEACEQIILDKIARRLGSGQQRSFQLHLVQLATNLQEQVKDLKQLTTDWQALVETMARVRSGVKFEVWIATREELHRRTQKAIAKEIK